MDPGSLQVNRRARRAKTDRLDAAMLLRALIAWCRGDRAACHMVQVPSVAREDARRTHRERQRLVAERVQHVNRIKGLLATQGINDYQPLRRDRSARLEELRSCDGHELPPQLRREINRELKRLELVLDVKRHATLTPDRRPMLTPEVGCPGSALEGPAPGASVLQAHWRADGAGGTCVPAGATGGETDGQARFLKRQLSLPVSTMSQ